MSTNARASIGLIAFDVDGTLVRGPDGMTVWEVLNLAFTGTPEWNKERYAAYKAGKLSYAEWVALDITGWREAGARRDDLIAAFEPVQRASSEARGPSGFDLDLRAVALS